VLPSIVIYPKYGAESARLVLSKLSFYFSLYRNIGWACSDPSYFVKMDALIYYTNGAVDLKMYYRNTLENYDSDDVKGDTFTNDYSKLANAKDLLS
jgi:hypothetical protein